VLHLQTSRHDEPEAIEAQGAAAWWAYSTADLFISVSPSLTGPLKRRLPSAPLVEIPNAVDVERFTPATAAERAELRRELGLPSDDPIVLFVGVMMPDKQPDVLFNAWLRQQERSGRRSTLVFVGASDPKLFELSGQLGAQLSRRADELGVADRVKFVPPTRQVERFFRAADVFVLPSAREGLPIVLLEAMACGLPCIASRLPGSTDVVAEDGVSARLVPSGDVEAMASALEDVLADPEQAAAMGRAARDAVMRRYTVQHVAEQWSAAYQSLRRRS
jgi:glycosyltransferase involved in cell wall biosynthesis